MNDGSSAVEVFVELVGEGTPCIRPTLALPLDRDRYKLLPTEDYDPAIETWECPPGSMVICRREKWGGSSVLVARRPAVES